MKLANPEFLFALLALAIPIIIHFFSFRQYKLLYFSQFHFLNEVKKERQKVSRLKNLLLLLSRLFFVGLLVLAFCEPYFPGSKNENTTDKFVIFLDNSLSMSLEGERGSNLQTAKNQSLAWLDAFPEQAKVNVLTFQDRPQQSRWLDKEEALREIYQIQTTEASETIDERLKKIRSLPGSNESQIIVLSDLQKQNLSETSLQNLDSLVKLVQVQPLKFENVSIDSVWFSSPIPLKNKKLKLGFKVSNYGTSNREKTSVRLYINEQLKSAIPVDIPAGSTVEGQFVFLNQETGRVRCRVSLDDQPVDFDNNWFISYESLDVIPVVEIYEGENNAFEQLLSADAEYQLKRFSSRDIDFDVAGAPGALIVQGVKQISSALRELIIQKLNNGSTVLLFPPGNADINSYNSITDLPIYSSRDTSTSKVSEIHLGHAFFDQMFGKMPKNPHLPTSKGRIQLVNQGNLTRLMSFRDAPAINWEPQKRGHIMASAFTSERESGDLYKHAMFVPMVLRALELSRASQTVQCYSGQANPVHLTLSQELGDEQLTLKSKKSEQTWLPTIYKKEFMNLMDVSALPLKPEHYSLFSLEQELALLSVNASRNESAMDFWSEGEVKAAGHENISRMTGSADKISGEIKAAWFGYDVWHWFAAVALFFLLIEMLIIRLL